MPNYSLRLRPRYGPDEPTGGERIASGVQQFFAGLDARQQAEREERNRVAAMGGQPMDQGAEPGVMGRIRGIGDAIRRKLMGDPVEAGMQTGTDVRRDGFVPPIDPGFTPNTRTLNPPLQPTPPFAPRTNDLNPRGGAPAARPFTPQITFNATPPAGPSRDGRQVPSGGVPADNATPAAPVSAQALPKRGGFAEAISPYIYEGRGGQKYSVDPLYQTRVGAAGREMELDAADERSEAKEGREQARREASIQQQIDALTAAGMPEPEARARVRTGTVRYDETFGQYRPNNGNLTPAERSALQKQKDDAAYQRALLAREGKQNTDEYKRISLNLQLLTAQLAAADHIAGGFEKVAGAADKDVPQNPIDRTIAESQPGGKERIAKAESTANANRDSAAATRQRAAQPILRMQPIAPRDDTAAGQSKFTADQARTRALQLKQQGKTKQQVYDIMRQEGYNVLPPKGDVDLRTPR